MPSMDRKALFDALHLHYNETFDVVKAVWGQRNTAAAYLFVSCAAVLLPAAAQNVIVKRLLGAEVAMGHLDFHLLAQLAVSVLIILVTQRQLYVDKHYVYLAGLEQRMELVAGVELVSRESTFYTQAVPRLQSRLRYNALHYGVVFTFTLLASAKSLLIVARHRVDAPLHALGALGGLALAALLLLSMHVALRRAVRRAAIATNATLRERLERQLAGGTAAGSQAAGARPEPVS